MSVFISGMSHRMVESVRRNTPRSYGHTEKMKSKGFIKKIHMNEVEGGSNRRGRSFG